MKTLLNVAAICAAAAIATLHPSFAMSQTKSEPTSTAAVDALKEYKAAVAELGEKYTAASKKMADTYSEEANKLKAALSARLEQARKDATTADNLDEAIRLRDAIRGLASLPTAPPGTESKAKPSPTKPRDGDDHERKKLEAENARLKARLAEKESAAKTNIVGTQWQGGGTVIAFLANGEATHTNNDGVLAGKYVANPDGTLQIHWANSSSHSFSVNPSASEALFITADGKNAYALFRLK